MQKKTYEIPEFYSKQMYELLTILLLENPFDRPDVRDLFKLDIFVNYFMNFMNGNMK